MFKTIKIEAVTGRASNIGATAAVAFAHTVIRQSDPVLDQKALNAFTALLRGEPGLKFIEGYVPHEQAVDSVHLREFFRTKLVDCLGYIGGFGNRRAVGVPGVNQSQCFMQIAQAPAVIPDIRFNALQTEPDRWFFCRALSAVLLPLVVKEKFTGFRIDR